MGNRVEPKTKRYLLDAALVFDSNGRTVNEFLIYLFHHQPFIDYAKSTTTGVQHPRTSWNSLKRFEFALPPLTEQRDIARILSTVQAAIAKQDELIQTTEALKKVLMHKLFTEGLNGEPIKETEIGPVPESWDLVPLCDTGEVIYGIQAAVANSTKPEGHIILTNINIKLNGGIDLEKLRYYKLKSKKDLSTVLKKGDILFNWRSGSKEHVGKTALFDLAGEFTHSSFILRIRPNLSTNNTYLFYYLNFLRMSGYFMRQQDYAVNAKFNKSAIERVPIILPSKDEQERIGNILGSLDRKLAILTSRKQTLKTLFQTLLHELMTGQRRVSV